MLGVPTLGIGQCLLPDLLMPTGSHPTDPVPGPKRLVPSGCISLEPGVLSWGGHDRPLEHDRSNPSLIVGLELYAFGGGLPVGLRAVGEVFGDPGLMQVCSHTTSGVAAAFGLGLFLGVGGGGN